MIAAADLAMAYVSQEKFAQAEPLAREAVQTDSKVQPDYWQRFRAQSLLGASLAGQKNFAEAEPFLVEGYKGMLARNDSIDVPDRYNLELARKWLVSFTKTRESRRRQPHSRNKPQSNRTPEIPNESRTDRKFDSMSDWSDKPTSVERSC